MGVTKSMVQLLMNEEKKIDFKGKKLLQLGRQTIFLGYNDVIELLKKGNYLSLNFQYDKKKKYIDDITLFSLLGFGKVDSLDYSSYEQASIIHDLNKDIPVDHHNKYDVIFDGGTLEHVFNVPNVLKNIHMLLKEGGVIIHSNPSHNNVDHGFYMFSPTLFSDYYLTNSYKLLSSYFYSHQIDVNASWKVFEYIPGCLDSKAFGGFGNEMLGVWFVAQKQATSTYGKTPQQAVYLRVWKGDNGSKRHRIIMISKIREWLKKIKTLRFIVFQFRKILKPFKPKFSSLKRVNYF